MSVGAIKAGSAFVELFTRNNRLVSGLADASRRLRQFGSNVQAIGRQMAMFGIGAAIPIGLSIRRFMEFDDQMRIVRAVTEGTESEFRSLTERAMELGAVSGFTAVQVASLMAELGRAGFARSEIDAATTSILNLARAASEDVTLVSTIVGETLRQFGLAADQATRVADTLTVAANSSITTVESLGEALQYVGPVAAQFNLSLEDTLAILAALGNIGIQGSNAGTALRRLLILTGTQAEQLQQLFGVGAIDAAGNARHVADILADIDQSLEGLGTAERQRRLFDLFGFLGITGASGIGANISNVRELQAAIGNAGGAAAAAAAQMDAGVGGTWRRMLGAVEALALAIGDALEEAVILIGNAFRHTLNDVRDWIRANREAIIITTAVVTSIIGIGVALIGLGITFRLVGFAIGTVGAILAVVGGAIQIVLSLIMGIMSPLGLVVMTLTAGALAWLHWSQAGQTAVLGISAALGQIARIAQLTMGGIMDALSNRDLEGAMNIAWVGMQAAWASGIAALRELWREFRDWTVDMFWGAIYSIGRGFLHLVNGMNSALVGIFRGMIELGNVFGLDMVMDEATLNGLFADIQGAGGANALLNTLNQMQEEERQLREQQRAAAAAGDQEEVQRLRRELERLRNEQAEARRWREFEEMWAEAEMGGRGAAATGRGIAGGLAAAAGDIQTAGTFSGAAVAGLGAGPSLAQRTNQLLEGINRQIQGLRQDVREGGAEFA